MMEGFIKNSFRQYFSYMALYRRPIPIVFIKRLTRKCQRRSDGDDGVQSVLLGVVAKHTALYRRPLPLKLKVLLLNLNIQQDCHQHQVCRQ